MLKYLRLVYLYITYPLLVYVHIIEINEHDDFFFFWLEVTMLSLPSN